MWKFFGILTLSSSDLQGLQAEDEIEEQQDQN